MKQHSELQTSHSKLIAEIERIKREMFTKEELMRQSESVNNERIKKFKL